MKERIAIFLFSILMIFLPSKVLANSIKSEIILNSEDITQGETLKATVKLTQEENENLNVLHTRIDFDENIFAGIELSSFKGINGWTDIEYNPETHTLIAINKYGSTLEEDIVSFELRLNSSAVPCKTKIGLKNTIVSSTTASYNLENIESDIHVNLLSTQIMSNKNLPPNYGKQSTDEPVRLYYILTIIVLELVIAIILVLIYYAASNKSTTSKAQKKKLAVVLSLIEIVSISAFFGFDIVKGDLNGDKVVDFQDVYALARHITNSEKLAVYKLEKADLDGDGRLTPRDLALLVDRSFTKTSYEAKLTNTILEENGYEKGSLVEIRFLADVTNDEKIEYVLIEGKKYKVDKSLDLPNEYSLKIEASNISEKYNYNISEIILANGRSAKVDYDASIVVLKDIPKLSNFMSKEDVEHGKMNVAFTITDDDDAITNATYQLVKSNGNIAMKGNLTKGKNSLSLPLENAVEYKFAIKISYNRGADSGEYFGIIEDSYDLKLITDYKFQINNMKLVQNGYNLKEIEKNTETFIEFSSSNISNYVPKKLTVNSREYTVTNLGKGKFRVRIPNTVLTGEPLKITKSTLSNGKSFTLKESIKYNILKDKPSIEAIDTKEDSVNGTLNINIRSKDTDKTIEKYEIELYDTSNNLIGSIETTEPSATLKTNFTSKYLIKVYADYDRGYGVNSKKELLYETSIEAEAKAILDEATLSEIYPDKNSIVNIDYKIRSNHNLDAIQVIIDNVIYTVQKVGIDTYRVEMPVGDAAGVKTYNLEKVIFENGSSYNLSNTLKLDILKDAPLLENFKLEEDLEDNRISVSFDLFDLDSAFAGGLIKLIDVGTEEIVASKDIISGKNTVTFDIKEDKKYYIGIYADAVLDTQELEMDSKNILKDLELYSVEYMAIKDYDLKITDIDIQNDFYNKNEPVDITFAQTNKTDYYPIKVKVDGIVYDVEKTEEAYKFTIDSGSESGLKTLIFESITLSNHMEISVNCVKTFEVLKSAPEIDHVEIVQSEDKIDIIPNLIDEESTIKNIKISISDASSNIIYENTTLETIQLDKSDDVFNIEIVGTYDVGTSDANRNIFRDIVLFDRSFSAHDKYIDTTSLKTFYFKDDDILIKEMFMDRLGKVKFQIKELDDENIEYFIKKYEITPDNKVLVYITSNSWFAEDNTKRSRAILEIGNLENELIKLAN